MKQSKLTYTCNLPDSAFTMVDGKEFCGQCQTSIVDFTVMSDEEIRHYVSMQSGRFCVKINSDQLNRIKGRTTSLRQRFSIAVAAALLAFSNKADARLSDSVKTEQVDVISRMDTAVHIPSPADLNMTSAGKQGVIPDKPLFKKRPRKERVFLRLRRREFYVVNRAPFFGVRLRIQIRGGF